MLLMKTSDSGDILDSSFSGFDSLLWCDTSETSCLDFYFKLFLSLVLSKDFWAFQILIFFYISSRLKHLFVG